MATRFAEGDESCWALTKMYATTLHYFGLWKLPEWLGCRGPQYRPVAIAGAPATAEDEATITCPSNSAVARSTPGAWHHDTQLRRFPDVRTSCTAQTLMPPPAWRLRGLQRRYSTMSVAR